MKKMAALHYIYVVLCLLSTLKQLPSISVGNYSDPMMCSGMGLTFLPSNLSCVGCGSSMQPTENGLMCVCESGLARSANGSCTECPSESSVARDGVSCVACPAGTYEPSTRQCSPCGRLQFFDDDFVNGIRSCVTCPSGTQANGEKCASCRFSDCRCPQLSAGVCLNTGETTSFAGLAQEFAYYRTYYPSAHYLCLDGTNDSACQVLRNLCSLDMFLESTLACRDVPDVYYTDPGDLLLTQDSVSSQFVTRGSTTGNAGINIVLAASALNGSFVGMLSGAEELMLCSDPVIQAAGEWPVGVSYQYQCTVSMASLVARSASPLFYSPSPDLRVGSTLYSVPVLLDGYRSTSGSAVNQGTDRSLWRLVRLFHLVESTSSEGDSVSYASSIELRVEPKGNGQINPPFLKVIYASVPSTATDTVTVEVKVTYEQSLQAQLIGVCVTLAVLYALGLLFVAFKVYGYLRRSGRNFCNLPALLFLGAECCAMLAGLILVLLLVTTFFLLLFYKSQVPLLLVLPTDQQELLYIILLTVATLCELVHIAYLLWSQCTTDVFFIDWEKPKGRVVVSDPSGGRTSTAEGTLKVPPVSIWRTYFVANEWNEIQSARKGHPLILLLATLLLVQVVGLGNLGAREPAAHVVFTFTTYQPPPSRVLRFAIAAVIYCLLAAVLRLYVLLFHERFIEHKSKQFVDLCSVSNISVLLLSHLKYGHYIHGRSVHGFADTDMSEMCDFFKKEENNLVAKRGLGSESDDQVYDVALTDNFRKYFNTILLSSRSQDKDQQRSQSVGVSQNRLTAYAKMNGFLSSFIDKSIPELGYVEQKKTLMEKVLDFEFHDPTDRSIFYARKGTSFDSVLFYGKEFPLFLLDVLVFTLVDMAAFNFTLAAIVTFLMQWIISLLRDALGRRNLARKTLVDKRFLI